MKHLVIMTRGRYERELDRRLREAALEANRGYERDLLMKQANIAALQSQINPHFLYNTLECIRGQALSRGADDIAATTQALSRFFRYSISSKSDIVTIRDEMENVRNYVTIQKYRFKNRFELEVEADEEGGVLDALMPKLSLQPVLENAIIHGFADITEGGRIRVAVRKTDKNICIEVSDNGGGMSVEQLGRLSDDLRGNGLPRRAEEPGDGEEHTGIGLRNVDQRLKLFFGDRYGISISSSSGLGTDVEFFFPFSRSLEGA